MDKKLKIGLIIGGIVIISTASFFAIKFYTLRKAYSKKLSLEDVMKLIDEKTEDIGTEMEDDPDLQIKSTDSTGIMGGDLSDLTDAEFNCFIYNDCAELDAEYYSSIPDYESEEDNTDFEDF
jgi:hypothetical protein